MKHLKPAAFALLATMAFAAPALAQGAEGGMMRENEFRIVMSDGHTRTATMTDAKTMAEVMKHATPVASGQIVFMHGGKMYSVQDMKMPDGRLLSEHLGSRG
jgi:hypothetical protein